MSIKSFESASEAQTRAFAASLAPEMAPGTVLLLSGDLGAGKTCFCSGLAEGLGIKQEVSSPTFTLINEYLGGRLPLFHIDLYRLEGARAIDGLGLDEYFEGPGVSLVEWAERLGPEPAGAWHLNFRHAGADTRVIELRRP